MTPPSPRVTVSIPKVLVTYLLGVGAGGLLAVAIYATATDAFRAAPVLIFMAVIVLLGWGAMIWIDAG